MLKNLLSGIINTDTFSVVLNGIYYGLILLAIGVTVFLVYRKLLSMGYGRWQARKLSLFALVTAFPAGIVSSRAAAMFYAPPEMWGVRFFIEKFMDGGSHTFHSSLVLPFLLILLAALWMRFRLSDVLDTLFLYVPVGHAVGRLGCFLVGCCWGKRLDIAMLGCELHCANPVPLYSIALNLVLYYFILKRCHGLIYASADRRRGEGRNPFGGMVLGLYLVLYGVIRMVMELFRRESVIWLGLTQAQVVMLIFMGIGISLLAGIAVRNVFIENSVGNPGMKELSGYFSLSGALVSYLIFSAVVFYSLSSGLVVWPFHGANTVFDAWKGVVTYSPALLFSLVSLIWLKQAEGGDIIGRYFKWERFSKTGWALSFFSLLYSADMFRNISFRLQGVSFWPPVLVLCVMNAIAEEILYRVVFMGIIRRVAGNFIVANILQGLIYSLAHFYIGGGMFGLLAFIYGLLLGGLRKRSNSIFPAIICHFCIDLGNIGLPVLIMR